MIKINLLHLKSIIILKTSCGTLKLNIKKSYLNLEMKHTINKNFKTHSTAEIHLQVTNKYIKITHSL